jgi:hypothetical protein
VIGPRSLALARSVIARHAGRHERAAGVSMRLARRHRPRARTLVRHEHRHFSSRLSLTLAPRVIVPAAPGRAGIATAGHTDDATRALGARVGVAPLAPARQRGVAQVLRRVVTRTERVAEPPRTLARPASGPSGESDAATPARAVPRRLVPARRAQTSEDPPEPRPSRGPAPAVSVSEPALPHRALERRGLGNAVPAPPLDVARLTDQVLETIDRRILAERERLGG